jgi:hypothetical protein
VAEISRNTNRGAGLNRIMHPKFGDGIIELVTSPRKNRVFFTGGRKVLAHDHD